MVDDSPLETALIERSLSARYQVETFSDGVTLIERLGGGPGPDALVLDWQMPAVSGLEVCRFLRERWDAAALPILLLTVHNDPPQIVEALQAGANDHVSKPFNPAELSARVATLVHIHRLSLRLREAESRARSLVDTARRERSRAEAANRAKDEFLATMSHELRTPLNAILGWAQMLRGGRLPAEAQARALETIERNARAQGQIIEDLLDVSRIITGKMRLSIESVDLAQIVEEAIDSLRLAAQAKGVKLETRVDESAGLLLGDAQRLKQIVWNLLSNAVKFTPAEGRVSVSLKRGHDAVELCVSDTGRGINADFLPHVFERFRQADSTTTRELGGLGLGLAIVRHLVELHGGTIQASSEGEGKGAAFTVCLPMLAQNTRELSPPPPLAADEALPFMASSALAGLRVLLVDDEPDTRELLGSVLQSCQAQVTSASSAAEALSLFEGQPFDLVLSDIGMPGEDGLSLIRRIRALPVERGGQTPSVALSAYARSDDRTRALVAGFNAHVPKPVQPAELVAVVAGLARTSHPPRSRR